MLEEKTKQLKKELDLVTSDKHDLSSQLERHLGLLAETELRVEVLTAENKAERERVERDKAEYQRRVCSIQLHNTHTQRFSKLLTTLGTTAVLKAILLRARIKPAIFF